MDSDTPLLVVGWREWVSLPDLGIKRIKAKIDTGARSSSLHAFDVQNYDCDGKSMVRFKVHPVQRIQQITVECEAEVHDVRLVRSSSGAASERYVILTPVSWMGDRWMVELTLADRSEMGFRMLIGREAIRGRMLVDPSRSYFGGRPSKRQLRNPNA